MKQISVLLTLLFCVLQFSSCANHQTQEHRSFAAEEIGSETQANENELEGETEASKALKDIRKKEAQEEAQRIQRSITEIEPPPANVNSVE